MNDDDITHNSLIEIEKDNYEMYLSALVEDIESLDIVLSIIKNESDLEITAKERTTENQLTKAIRPFLSQLNCDFNFIFTK